MRTAEVVERTRASYRQIDYWLRQGVPACSVGANGSGSHRDFSEIDMKICDILAVLSTMMGSGNKRFVYTEIYKLVAEQIQNDPTILDRDMIFIDRKGIIQRYPVEGWVVESHHLEGQ